MNNYNIIHKMDVHNFEGSSTSVLRTPTEVDSASILKKSHVTVTVKNGG